MATHQLPEESVVHTMSSHGHECQGKMQQGSDEMWQILEIDDKKYMSELQLTIDDLNSRAQLCLRYLDLPRCIGQKNQ